MVITHHLTQAGCIHQCTAMIPTPVPPVWIFSYVRSASLSSWGVPVLSLPWYHSVSHCYCSAHSPLTPIGISWAQNFTVLVDCYIRCSLALSYSRLSWSTNMADRAPLMTVNYFKLLLLHFHNQTSHDSWELSPGSNIHGVLHRKKNRLNFSKMGCTPRWKGSTTVRGQVNYTAKDTGNRSVAEMETNYRSQLLE